MAEKDFVDTILTLEHKGVFDFDQLYKSLHRWFKLYKYGLNEIDYKDYREDGGHHLIVKWQAGKKLNDYVKAVMDIELHLRDMEDVMVEKKKKLKAHLLFKCGAYLAKDYEDTWKRKPVATFAREVYDKFALGNQMKSMEQQLKKEMHMFLDEIKSYLNLQKL